MFALHTDKADSIELVAATLTNEACWADAVEGCDAIFHIASPVPLGQPKNPDGNMLKASVLSDSLPFNRQWYWGQH
jgi:hypothetical protein